MNFRCLVFRGCAALLGVIASLGVAAAQEATLCRPGNTTDAALQACTATIGSTTAQGLDRATAYFLRSEIFRARNDVDRQFADLNDAIRIVPTNAPARLARGRVFRVRKSYDLARADYDAVIAADPGNADALFGRAYLLKEQGNNDQAFADYSRSLELNPNQSGAFNNRGVILREQGKLDAALSDFNQAIKLAPKNQFAHVGRGRTLGDMKDTAGALAEFTFVIGLNPKNSDAFTQRGYYAMRAGDNEHARADFNDALRIAPTNTIALINRGKTARSMNDIDAAIADFSRVMELDPNFTSAYIYRGQAYEAKGDKAHAIADFTEALKHEARYDSGAWALKTAKARLAALSAPTPRAETGDLFASAAKKIDKVALVIGNGAYENVPTLPNPSSDARAIAASLRDLGFAVIEGIDLGRRDMEDKIVAFLRSVPSAKVAVVFYAGHGVQVEGRNYLVPTDAKTIARATLSFELVDVDRILAGLDDETRANIIILDACRDDPLESRTVGRSAAQRGGLAAYSDVASGMMIAFATSPGKTANDGAGAHSPFTTALLAHVKEPTEINEMLRQVRVDVFVATNKEQLPWANSSLLGRVYLSGADGNAAK